MADAITATGESPVPWLNKIGSSSEHPPQRGARHADQPQPRADHQAEAGVGPKLGEKQPTEPLTGVVDRRRGALKVLGPQAAPAGFADSASA